VNEEEIKASLRRHAASPGVSVRAYVDSLTAETGASIGGRRKLYLDTRYWIHLRDASMGRATRSEHVEILSLLRSLVSAGSIAVPISDVAWLEISKQTDPATRRVTMTIVEELSMGVALMGEEDRASLELEEFMNHPGLDDVTQRLKDRVWVRAAFALGFAIPAIPEMSSAEQRLAAQKACVDLFWQMPLSELDEVARSTSPIPDRWDETAARITADMQRHAGTLKSLKQAFDAEIAGAFRVYKGRLRELIVARFRAQSGNDQPIPTEDADRAAEKMLTGLTNAFRLKREQMATQLPTLYAYAMCHAAVRMDKKRKFNGNDLLDIHHASSGIPYYEAVFTENPLRVLVTGGNVKLDQKFNCKVLSKEEDVVAYLKTLGAP
jgi:hypothetical protein